MHSVSLAAFGHSCFVTEKGKAKMQLKKKISTGVSRWISMTWHPHRTFIKLFMLKILFLINQILTPTLIIQKYLNYLLKCILGLFFLNFAYNILSSNWCWCKLTSKQSVIIFYVEKKQHSELLCTILFLVFVLPVTKKWTQFLLGAKAIQKKL